jgi:hypothetical protein
MEILNSVDNRRIILIQEVDYDPVDLQLIYWLAKGGVRLDGVDAPNAHRLITFACNVTCYKSSITQV